MSNTYTRNRRLPTGRGGDYYTPATPKPVITGNPQRSAPNTNAVEVIPVTVSKPTVVPKNLPISRGGDTQKPATAKVVVVNNPQRPVPAKTENESPSVLDRTWDTITGSTKQSVGNFGSGLSTLTHVGQSNLLREEEMKYDRERRKYEQMLSDNQITPGTWDNDFLKAKEKELNAKQRMLEVGKQSVAESSLVQGANSLRDYSAALAQSGARDIADAKEGLGTVGRFLVDTGAAGTQLVGDAFLAGLTGGMGVLPVKAVQAFGSGAEQARAAGADLNQQAAYGLANSALSLGTEKLFNLATPLKKTYGRGLLESPLAGALNSFRETAPIQMGLSALTEGGEEFVEALAQPMLQRAIYDPDAEIDIGDAFYQGFVGGTIGALTGGADAMSELDFSDGFLFGFSGEEVTQDPAFLHENLLQAKAYSEHDPISWVLVDAWDCGLQTKEEINAFYKDYLSYIGAENTSLYNIDKFLEAKYSNTKEFDLLRGYSKAVKKEDIFPLIGLDEYRATGKRIEESLVGITTSTNIPIQSFATHFIDRVIGQTSTDHEGMRRGIFISDVVDALQNPVEISNVQNMKDGDIRQKFSGKKISVTISIRDNRLVQVNPRKEKR